VLTGIFKISNTGILIAEYLATGITSDYLNMRSKQGGDEPEILLIKTIKNCNYT